MKDYLLKVFWNTEYFKNAVIGLTGIIIIASLNSLKAQEQAIIWKFTDVQSIGNYTPIIEGKPSALKSDNFTCILFNGINDGLTIPTNPVAGWHHFTIELLFKPDADGPKQPRLIHFEDMDKNRGTLELRLTPAGQWYMDAFLKNGKLNKGITLIDSTQLHPANQWYWIAMVYDGKKMSSYVNGVKQLESPMNFPVSGSGQIAIGMRLNKVNWFKGAISEVLFYPEALAPSSLQSTGKLNTH